jgi:hypothetical protein
VQIVERWILARLRNRRFQRLMSAGVLQEVKQTTSQCSYGWIARLLNSSL